MYHDGKSGDHDPHDESDGVKKLKAIWHITKDEKPIISPPKNICTDIYQVKAGTVKIPPRPHSR